MSIFGITREEVLRLIAASDGAVPPGVVFVSDAGDLPPPVGGIITLDSGKNYIVTGAVDLGTDRISIPAGNATLRGVNEVESVIITDIANQPAIEVNADYWLISDLQVRNNSTSGEDIRVDKAGSIGSMERVRLDGSNVGLMVNEAFIVYANLCSAVSTTDIPVYVDGQVGAIEFTQCTFGTPSGIGGNSAIYLSGSAVFSDRLRLDGCRIIPTDTNDNGVNVASRATTFASGSFLMHTTSFVGAGTAISGIDSDDPECDWAHMFGVDDSTSGGALYMYGNATPTSFQSPNTPTKVLGATTAGANLERFTMPANNRIQYNGRRPVEISVIGQATVTGGGNKDCRLVMALNGSIIESESHVRTSGSGHAYAVPITGRVEMSTGDYLELYVSNDTDGTSFTITDMYWSAHT